MQIGQINGIQFYFRDGYSDHKTFIEVIKNKAYEKHGMQIKENELWMDCGGNVGAFTLLACSKNAKVTVYEPDPYNCDMIEKNLKLNNFNAEIKNYALVHNNTEEAILFIGNNNQVWRNSIVKKWNNKGIKIRCLNFDKEAYKFDNCKMDIEGAEMLILENTKIIFKKLVYEWSFDIDRSINRLKKLINQQNNFYKTIEAGSILKLQDDLLPRNIARACTTIYCYAKN